jgi:excisionase family DNA binding protein
LVGQLTKASRWRALMSADIYEPLLNDAQATAFLGGLHPKTVQRMARRGEIPAFRIGRYYRYRASELDAWLRGQVVHYPCQASTRVNSEETIQ